MVGLFFIPAKIAALELIINKIQSLTSYTVAYGLFNTVNGFFPDTQGKNKEFGIFFICD